MKSLLLSPKAFVHARLSLAIAFVLCCCLSVGVANAKTKRIHVLSGAFIIASDSSQLTVPNGGHDTANLTVTETGAYSDTVNLTAKATDSSGATVSGISASMAPSSVAITSSASGASVLTVSSSGVAQGEYTLTVTGSDTNGVTATTTIEVDVAPNFSVDANPNSVTLAIGSNTTSTVTVTPENSFKGAVSLSTQVFDDNGKASTAISARFQPSTLTISDTNPQSATLTITAPNDKTIVGDYDVEVTATDSSGNTDTCDIYVTVQLGSFTLYANPNPVTATATAPGSSTVYVTPFNSFQGDVTFTYTVSDIYGNPVPDPSVPNSKSLGVAFDQTSVNIVDTNAQSAKLTVTPPVGLSDDDYDITITGTDVNGNTAICKVIVEVTADFTLNANPNSLEIGQGFSLPSTITVTPLNSFSGTVSLSASAVSDDPDDDADSSDASGITTVFAPASVALSNGSTSTATVSVSPTTPVGDYDLAITGKDDNGNTATTDIWVTVGVPDFTLHATPSNVTIAAGNPGNTTLHAESKFSFAGDIGLSYVVTDSSGKVVTTTSTNGKVTGGILATFSPSPMTLTSGASATDTVTLSCATGLATGTYTVTITGASGSISHTATVTATVSNATLIVRAGQWQLDTTNSDGSDTIYVGDLIKGQVTATPSSGTITSVAWTTAQVWRSDTGESGTFSVYNGNYSIYWDTPQNPTDFHATFLEEGNYIISVNATATMSDGTTRTAIGYIGGNANDVGASTTTSSSSIKANVANANGKTPPAAVKRLTVKKAVKKQKKAAIYVGSIDMDYDNPIYNAVENAIVRAGVASDIAYLTLGFLDNGYTTTVYRYTRVDTVKNTIKNYDGVVFIGHEDLGQEGSPFSTLDNDINPSLAKEYLGGKLLDFMILHCCYTNTHDWMISTVGNHPDRFWGSTGEYNAGANIDIARPFSRVIPKVLEKYWITIIGIF